MRKSYSFLLGAFVISVLFLGGLAGCALDLDPAPSGKATVSLTMASLPYAANSAQGSSRAVVQGSGYLYIRPLGGPAGTGPKGYLGPYTITPKDGSQGGTADFSTTDIPAGVYDGLALLYSAHKIDDLEVTLGGAKTTFARIFGLSDAQFLAAFEAEDSSSIKVVSNALGGQASGTILKNVTIHAGKKNPLAAVLEPFTPYVYNVLSGGYSFTPPVSGSQRVFVRVQGLSSLLSAYSGTVDIQFSLKNTSSSSIAFNHAAAYGPSGAFITGSHSAASTVAAGASKTLTARWDGTDAVYLYLDYSGSSLAISASASTVKPSEAISVTVNNLSPNVMDQELKVLVISMGAEQTSFTGYYESVAVGMGLISGSSITVQLYGEDAEEEYSFMWKPSSPIRAGIILMTESGIFGGPGSTMDAIMPLYIGTFSAGSTHTVDTTDAQVVELTYIDVEGTFTAGLYYSYCLPYRTNIYFLRNKSDGKANSVGWANLVENDYWVGAINPMAPDSVYILVEGYATSSDDYPVYFISNFTKNVSSETIEINLMTDFTFVQSYVCFNSFSPEPQDGTPVTIHLNHGGVPVATGTELYDSEATLYVPLTTLEGDPFVLGPMINYSWTVDYQDESGVSQSKSGTAFPSDSVLLAIEVESV